MRSMVLAIAACCALVAVVVAVQNVSAITEAPAGIVGDYVEVRSCDVYTGPCFANGQWGQDGKEAILVWSVRQGSWQGVPLDNLSVIAVLCTKNTLANVHKQQEKGKALIIVDEMGNAEQRRALRDFAETMAGGIIEEVVAVRTSAITANIATCTNLGCASVKAGDLVEINTRCLGDGDHVCGNEYTYYPPLTKVKDAYPVFTELSKFTGKSLKQTWELLDERSGFLAQFAQ